MRRKSCEVRNREGDRSGQDTISIVNPEYFAKIKLREEEVPTRKTDDHETDHGRGNEQGTGASESGGQGRNGSDQGQRPLVSSGLTRLLKGDQGNDPLTPTVAQQHWEKRNPVNAAKLRAAVDR